MFGLGEQRGLVVDSLAGDQAVDFVQDAEVVVGAPGSLGVLVDPDGLGAFVLEEAEDVLSLDAESDDGDSLVSEGCGCFDWGWQGHLGTCNARATPRIPPAIPINQKRVTIWGSDQPLISK